MVKNMKKIENQRGFTMIELMIAVGLIGIVLSGLYQIYSLGWKMFTTGSVQIQLQQTARNAMDEMIGEVRQAKLSTVVISDYLVNLPFSCITFTDRRNYTVSYGAVLGTDPSIKGRGIKMDGGYAFIRRVVPLSVTANTAIATDLLCRNVQSVLFTYPQGSDKNTVLCSLTLYKKTYNGMFRTVQLKEVVQMMNP